MSLVLIQLGILSLSACTLGAPGRDREDPETSRERFTGEGGYAPPSRSYRKQTGSAPPDPDETAEGESRSSVPEETDGGPIPRDVAGMGGPSGFPGMPGPKQRQADPVDESWKVTAVRDITTAFLDSTVKSDPEAKRWLARPLPLWTAKIGVFK